LTLLEELAEDIEVHLPAPPSVEKLELPDCVLIDETGLPWAPAGGVHRTRFDASSVEERVPELRAMFRERGRDEFTWWVGTSSTPDDLEDRLLGLGASPYSDDPVIAAMISKTEPPDVGGFDVRRVDRVEEFSIAREIAWSTADSTDEQLARIRETLPERWEWRQRVGHAVTFLAYVDGEPVATGDMVLLPFAGFLSGATTLPDYRGRGAFSALVRARWDEAVRRGTPALAVGAGKMSRPILERIGFTTVAEQHLLVDRSGLTST
jgi:GNAT superfamily N-acetyltransferase